jgi:acetylornithine deacetylase/succinyl-diaminopimelate desuccinylase-like protein
MKRLYPFLLACWCVTSLAGPLENAQLAQDWRIAHEQELVDRFASLLRIPNVASDHVNIRRNAEHIRDMLEARGLDAELLELEGANPLIFGSKITPGATRTVMVYIHYDGQPVNPGDWESDPWTPVMRTDMVENDGQLVPMQAPFDPEWRIFARSAGDDKAPVIALTAALDALAANNIEPSVNLKIIMDGEEEAGSPNLVALLQKHRDKLDSDLWLFCDGPVHQSRRWKLSYGVRGAYGFNLTVYGPNRPLHSGHYGNWAPNPIVRLTQLVSSMRDEAGTILINGFHDEVRAPSSTELAAIAATPSVEAKLLDELGLASAETDERVELAIMRPALNLRGIQSGDTGAAARNSIQPSASASIGLRLVPDQTPAHLRSVVEEHITAQGYFVVHDEPTAAERITHARLAFVDWGESGYPAYRANMDEPAAQQVSAILMQLSDGALIRSPSSGASLPLHPVQAVMQTPIVMLPIANHDNNQHGKNENLRLQNLWDAIEIYAAVLTGL